MSTPEQGRAVAIFGGTFNPIHIGHLRSALELVERLGLAELRFLPSALPPHREPPAVDAQRRAHMVELAIAGEARFACDRRELERDGPSYTIDSLESLREELGTACSLLLVMGCDALRELPSWHRWQDLLKLCHIVAIGRPGWSLPDTGAVADYLAARAVDLPALTATPGGGVHVLHLRPLAVSATEIRRLVQSGLSLRYLVPEEVREYIEQQQLYSE